MWLILAVSASIIWSFDYAFGERLLRHISVSTLLLFQGLVLFLVSLPIVLMNAGFRKDLAVIGSSGRMALYFVVPVSGMVLGNFLVASSIQSKNATLAGLIEISYPLTIALISWWLFKENQVNASVAAGGLLIFAGIFIIYSFNK